MVLSMRKNCWNKTNEIYVSEIKELIENIKGVVSVDQIDIFKNGIKVFDDLIPFGEDSYPSLEKHSQLPPRLGADRIFQKQQQIRN